MPEFTAPSGVATMELPPEFPWPTGTLVRGVDYTVPWPEGLPVRRSCEHHIFEVAMTAIAVEYGCGWAQSATCLVCDYTTAPIDASFWMKRADPDDRYACIDQIDKHISHLLKVTERIVLNTQPIALQDFG